MTPGSLEPQHTLTTAVARYNELRTQDLLAPAAADPSSDDPDGPARWPSTKRLSCSHSAR